GGQLQAVAVREVEVERDQVVGGDGEPVDRPAVVVGDVDGVPLPSEPHGDGIRQIDLVLHHKHAHHCDGTGRLRNVRETPSGTAPPARGPPTVTAPAPAHLELPPDLYAARRCREVPWSPCQSPSQEPECPSPTDRPTSRRRP